MIFEMEQHSLSAIFESRIKVEASMYPAIVIT